MGLGVGGGGGREGRWGHIQGRELLVGAVKYSQDGLQEGVGGAGARGGGLVRLCVLGRLLRSSWHTCYRTVGEGLWTLCQHQLVFSSFELSRRVAKNPGVSHGPTWRKMSTAAHCMAKIAVWIFLPPLIGPF